MRQLHEHQVNPCNRRLHITADDGPGPGGANHVYSIAWTGPIVNADADITGACNTLHRVTISFQNGPVGRSGAGVNGVTHEALLAIVADRLRSFQAGPYACRENALALTKIEEALHWLNHRTARRTAEGVEGTMKQDCADPKPDDPRERLIAAAKDKALAASAMAAVNVGAAAGKAEPSGPLVDKVMRGMEQASVRDHERFISEQAVRSAEAAVLRAQERLYLAQAKQVERSLPERKDPTDGPGCYPVC